MEFEIKGDYFNDTWVLPQTKGTDATERFLHKESPSDDKKLWTCPIDYRHIDPLVDCSIQGFRTWRNTPIEDRIHALKRYQEHLASKKELIATAISWETGKPFWEAHN